MREEILIQPQKGKTMVATFDEGELVVVLFEAMMQMHRPPQITVADAIGDIEGRRPDLSELLFRQADAALQYFVDRMKAATPQVTQ